MTSTELIKDMLERQKAYDTEVFKKHNITSVSRQQLESALFDELEVNHKEKMFTRLKEIDKYDFELLVLEQILKTLEYVRTGEYTRR